MDHYKRKEGIKIFSNKLIEVIGHVDTTVIYDNWTCKDARLTIVVGGHKIIIGRDHFNSLGLAILQQQQPENGKCVNNIDNSTCNIKKTIAAQFPHLVLRIGLSKTHVAKSKFHQRLQQNTKKVDAFPLIYNPRLRRN